MLKKGPAPTTTHESDPEAIVQRIEMRRNEAKDIQWEAVDGGE